EPIRQLPVKPSARIDHRPGADWSNRFRRQLPVKVEPRSGSTTRFSRAPAVWRRLLPGALVVEDEGNHQVDAVADDRVVLHIDLLLLDPGAFDVAERPASSLDTDPDGILEALLGRAADLRDARDGHDDTD